VLFEERDAIGGQLAVAAAAPHRSGWRALLDFYANALGGVDVRLAAPADDLTGFDEVVLAVGSTEVLPDLPGIARALRSSEAIASGVSGRHLLVVDDGFGWWPCASAVEAGVRAGCETITVVTPGPGFGTSLPPEGRVQLLGRLRGAPLEVRPLTTLMRVDAGWAVLRGMSGTEETVRADTVVVVGERVARDWSALVPSTGGVRVIGDALVPRKVSHAIAEGRAAAEAIAQALPRAAVAAVGS
jgi:hypothetical protein